VKATLIILALAAAALITAYYAVTGINPVYQSLSEARASGGRVRITGTAHDINHRADMTTFRLHDHTGDTVQVRYAGTTPALFTEASPVMLSGRFQDAGASFAAEELLTRCPSRYQPAR
jgi:cytochrome c-type biogenesis protein CcmE